MMMSSKLDRKQAIREFKEAVVPQGVYAITCSVTGEKWVGASRNLNAQKNSTWAQLKGGMHRSAPLLAAWKRDGEEAFSLEVLERFPEDTPDILRDAFANERRAAWAEQLGALAI